MIHPELRRRLVALGATVRNRTGERHLVTLPDGNRYRFDGGGQIQFIGGGGESSANEDEVRGGDDGLSDLHDVAHGDGLDDDDWRMEQDFALDDLVRRLTHRETEHHDPTLGVRLRAMTYGTNDGKWRTEVMLSHKTGKLLRSWRGDDPSHEIHQMGSSVARGAHPAGLIDRMLDEPGEMPPAASKMSRDEYVLKLARVVPIDRGDHVLHSSPHATVLAKQRYSTPDGRDMAATLTLRMARRRTWAPGTPRPPWKWVMERDEKGNPHKMTHSPYDPAVHDALPDMHTLLGQPLPASSQEAVEADHQRWENAGGENPDDFDPELDAAGDREFFARKYAKAIPSYDPIVAHAAKVLDNPMDNLAVQSFADHLGDAGTDPELSSAFVEWVNGRKDFKELIPLLHPRKLNGLLVTGNYPEPPPGEIDPLTPEERQDSADLNIKSMSRYVETPTGLPTMSRRFREPHWHVRTTRGRGELEDRGTKRKLSSLQVADAVHKAHGPAGLVLAVIGARHFHPDAPRRQSVARGEKEDRSVKFRRRPRRYAKVDGHEPAHPLVAGFPLEHALRHLTNDPKNTESVRAIAKSALTGKGRTGEDVDVPTSLWSLHDALHESGHPMAEGHYNWMSAADKVTLDAHTHEALRREAERDRQNDDGHPVIEPDFHYSPEGAAHRIGRALREERSGHGGVIYQNNYEALDRVRKYVKKKAKDAAPEDVNASIMRHAYRARLKWMREVVGDTNYHEGDHLLPRKDVGPNRPFRFPHVKHQWEEQDAARYKRGAKKYLKPRNDFIDALRRIRSTNQDALHKVVNDLSDKLGLRPHKTLNALHDTPHGSTPGVAVAVYGPASPENVQQAASWIGLTSNSPGVSVFHTRDGGPDLLHRVRHDGSGMELRSRLDRFGITQRVLVPHKKGFDVLVPDKGGTMTAAVAAYAAATKTVPETSSGFISTAGSADRATARAGFRGSIAAGERMKLQRKIRYSHKAFQEAIAHNESESTHRAAYADWIEENAPESATQEVLHRLRNHQGRMWVGLSPKGKVLAIPTVTKEWLAANPYANLFHRTSTNRKGQAHSVRQSGRMKTWKTRPEEFRVPWKFGLYQNGEVTHRNAHEWLTEDPTAEPEDSPLRNSRKYAKTPPQESDVRRHAQTATNRANWAEAARRMKHLMRQHDASGDAIAAAKAEMGYRKASAEVARHEQAARHSMQLYGLRDYKDFRHDEETVSGIVKHLSEPPPLPRHGDPVEATPKDYTGPRAMSRRRVARRLS